MGTECTEGGGAPSSERVRDCPKPVPWDLANTIYTDSCHHGAFWRGQKGPPWGLLGAPPRPRISIYLAEMGWLCHLPRVCSTLCVCPLLNLAA